MVVWGTQNDLNSRVIVAATYAVGNFLHTPNSTSWNYMAASS